MSDFYYDFSDGSTTLAGDTTLYDTVHFGDDTGVFDWRNFAMARNGNNLVLYANNGNSIEITGYYLSHYPRIEWLDISGQGDLIYLPDFEGANPAGSDPFSTYGSNGNDYLMGGNVSGAGVYGEAGEDVIYSGYASHVHGGSGSDIIYASSHVSGANYYGESDHDTIYGNVLAEYLYGGDGNDMLYGGAGIDTLDGGAGIDTANFSDATAVVGVNLSTGVTAYDGFGYSETITGVENVTGSGYADEITGDSAANLLNGNAGNDTIHGNAGDDTLYGMDGNDALYGESGLDTIISGAGTDYLYGGDDTDSLNGGTQQDFLYGQNGDDTLYTGEGADYLYGGAGSDIFALYDTPTHDNDMAYVLDWATGDKIDLSALLVGYGALNNNILDFVNILVGANTTIQVDRNGLDGGNGWDNVLRLQGVSVFDSYVPTLISNGTLLV